MTSQVTEEFMACFARLPDSIKAQTRKAYQLWRANASHPSLHFKKIHGHQNLYSVRVALGWRALGLWDGDTITWFWVGSHAEYEQLIK